MPSLENCLVTQWGPVFENSGDTGNFPVNTPNANGQLELQTQQEIFDTFGGIPTWFAINDTSFDSVANTDSITGEMMHHGYYFLKISAQPAYHVYASLFNINNQEGIVIEPDNYGYPFGSDGISGSVISFNSDLHDLGDDNIELITLFNYRGDDNLGSGNSHNQCDNIVVVMVKVKPEFEMPSDSIEMLVKLRGSAIECAAEGFAFGQLEWRMDCSFFVTNFYNIKIQTNCTLSMAKYYEDGYFGLSSPTKYAVQKITSNTTLTELDGHPVPCGDGVYGPLEYGQLEPDCCLGKWQPTCFMVGGPYNYLSKNVDLWELEPSSDFLHPWSTIEGRIMLPPTPTGYNPASWLVKNTGWPYANMVTIPDVQFDTSYEILDDEVGGWSNQQGRRYRVINTDGSGFSGSGCQINDHYPSLNIAAHPVLYPGDGVAIPSKETWQFHLTPPVGASSDPSDEWEIIASPEFVDVWSAVTVVGVQDGVVQTTFPNNASMEDVYLNGGQMSLDNVTYFEYTTENNQCDMDISQAEITSCGQKCVQISVPYRSDVSWVRGTNYITDGPSFYSNWSGNYTNNNITDIRINKIFVNIYPTEIQ